MVLLEADLKSTKFFFNQAKSILRAAKIYKPGEKAEITVKDGEILLSGHGFSFNWEAFTTGTCKISFPILHWVELIKSQTGKKIKIVITEGEAMINNISVPCNTSFFDTDKILRTILLPANPKKIDYWKLEYEGYTTEEIHFNGLEGKIENAKAEFIKAIDDASRIFAPFRIYKENLIQMILERMKVNEKVNFKL